MPALGDEFFVQTFVTTLQKFEKQLVDNVLTEHPVLDLFKSNAKSTTGRGLVIPVRAANLSATGYTNASGDHSTLPSNDIMGAAVYTWANSVITPFRLKHREILQNSGAEQVVSLVEEYVKAASEDHKVFLANALYGSAGTYTDGDIIPLDVLISDSTTVGGIDPANSDWWKSTVKDIAVADKDIAAAFRETVNAIFKASSKRPTHVIVGMDVYEELEAYLANKGVVQTLGGDSASIRFSEIKFGSLTVRLDADCPNDTAYFIHQPSLRFAYLAGEFMKAYPAQRLEGKLDTVVPLASTIQVGTSERRAHGKLTRSA
jgi:hypothetical protein